MDSTANHFPGNNALYRSILHIVFFLGGRGQNPRTSASAPSAWTQTPICASRSPAFPLFLLTKWHWCHAQHTKRNIFRGWKM